MNLTRLRLFTVLPALRRPYPCPHRSFHTYTPLSTTRSPSQLRSRQLVRPIHTTHPVHTADRPTVLTNMLASDVPPPVQVSSVGPAGIKLADGLLLEGPVVFLEGKVFLWNVPAPAKRTDGRSDWEEWKREHWEIFEVVVPKPEILVFGTGARMELVPSSIRAYIKELGIQLDVMDTKNACSTYNLLAEEGRRVAAALLPNVPKQWAKKEGW
ncbi:NADH dehydrogenase 1 alpha subcomplex assembly factor 3 [Melanogaster broomeanus]|nr:NADH dehydrogenase 1 alpha subcomplex assembly factor 3 [Melanogaster broomeanus]